MGNESSKNIVKDKVGRFLEDVDQNKNRVLEVSEKSFTGDVKKQLIELRVIAGGPDVLKREALAKAIIEVTAEYEGLSTEEVFRWVNSVSGFGIHSGANGLDYKKGNRAFVSPVAVLRKEEIFPLKTLEGAKQAAKVDTLLLKILSGEKIDYNSLSFKQKVYLLTYFGELGKEGYDKIRRKDVFSGETISLNEFLEKMKKREMVKSIGKKYQKSGSLLSKNPENVDKMLDEISKAVGVDRAELKDMWSKSKDANDFAEKVNVKYFQSGVCRDIVVFQAKLASDIGLHDTFVTTATTRVAGHVVGGYRDEKGNIVFFNYGELIQTDTPNMKMALATIERHLGAPSLNYLQSKGGEEGANLVKIKSEASETLSEVARSRADQQTKVMTDVFDRGGLEHKGEVVAYAVEREKVKLDVSVDRLGGSMIISSRSIQPQSGANSIDEVNSLRLAQEFNGKYFAGGLAGSVAHISLKADSPGDKKQLDQFIANLYLKTHKKIKLTEHVEYQISAMADAILGVTLNKNMAFTSADFEVATGQRLSYIAPDMTLYVGMQTLHSVVPENIQQAGFNLKILTMTNDLLAANVGANIQLGMFKGHKVNIVPQVQIGKANSGLATEYQGDVKVEAVSNKGSLYLKSGGKYIGSDDFRIANEARKEISAGYAKSLPGAKVLEIKGFAFQDTSLGKLKDPRLDDLGIGFQVSYVF